MGRMEGARTWGELDQIVGRFAWDHHVQLYLAMYLLIHL